MNRPAPVRDRLFSKLVIDPSGCVLWTGSCDGDGYGEISVNGHKEKVHRVMFAMFDGPIPDGLTLDHVKARGCTHKNCANVAHLEPVTDFENNRRAQTLGFVNAAKTHCPAGHEYTPSNTHVRPDGSRQCRACGADYQRKKRQAQALTRIPDPDPGRHTRGESNGQARLGAEQVIAIRAAYADRSATAHELATRYGVHVSTIRAIVQGRKWKHLPVRPTADGQWVFERPAS